MAKLGILIWLVVFLSLSPGKVAAEEKRPLVVVYSSINANFLSLWVGKEAGYFDQEGLDVRILLVRGGSLVVQLLVSGQSPIAMVGATAITNAYLRGVKDLVMIGGVTNVMAYVLASRPEIQGPQDIKGKTLAVSRFGSTADFVGEYALGYLGLKKTDVTMLQIGTEPDRLAAMQRGSIALSVFTPTYVPALRKAGMKVLLDLEEMRVPYLLNGYATTRSFVSRDRAAAIGLMRGVIRAIKRIKSDREFTGKILAKYARTADAEVINGALDQQMRILPDLPVPPEAGIKTILEDLGRSVPEARHTPPDSLIDPSIVREAAKGP